VRRGRVLEKGSNRPVDKVRITFEREDGRVTRVVQSDEDGRYRIRLPAGRYVVTTHRFGYQPFSTRPGFVVFRAKKTGTFNIVLEETPQQETRVDLWESVQLIGLVCTRTPRSPDPDPGLTWA
jgi:hypothetical protein